LTLAPNWAEQLAYFTSQFHEENPKVFNTAGGAPRTSVSRLCEGFLYLRNTIRFYPTQASVIFVTAIRKVRPFLHRFKLLTNTRRYCVQISDADFHLNWAVHVESTSETIIYIRPVSEVMPLSTTFRCDVQSKPTS
jgi:hypothetical protein